MLNQTLVAELRQMFVDGATPSRLMQHIAAQHPNDPRLHHIIVDYFEEAFRLPLLRNVVPGDDYSPGSRHAHYNRDVVPEMIHAIQDWNRENLTGTWLNGAVVHSLAEHVAQLSSSHFQELDRIWDTLSNEERQFLIRKMARVNHDWEIMKALARHLRAFAGKSG